MKDKIYDFVALIIYWVTYGVAIGCIIFEGFQNGLELAWFILISIWIIIRTFIAAIILLGKEKNYERTRKAD